ncbi:MAG: pseudouridine synthase [Gammaproteobacteria bacterium]|nr:pseudouridine synthase [Gammaproteobacteria bacterium]MCP4088314.1 pseudouridine synthase [Gammaproteobacteria bacterium]MCP4276375.1 pseudouridine synthase [Gammaproteobacteria bacterium]MCP4831022.1 pseudouridine synthase [Gammaproteobacteria bacterium]MCP4927457.1 pseudouridine synthase [Gammaproteobacteria bacterium]
MSRIVLFNKPFRVLSQFRDTENKVTLSNYFDDPKLRIAGRLDFDSEGLLILTDNGQLLQKITHPRYKLPKTYWAQIEGKPDREAIGHLRTGIKLKDGRTQPAKAKLIEQPINIWKRDPPIRYRASIPTSWIELTISEGRNRQVRRMTAAVGFPTLRLIRTHVGEWELGKLQPGESYEI